MQRSLLICSELILVSGLEKRTNGHQIFCLKNFYVTRDTFVSQSIQFTKVNNNTLYFLSYFCFSLSQTEHLCMCVHIYFQLFSSKELSRLNTII